MESKKKVEKINNSLEETKSDLILSPFVEIFGCTAKALAEYLYKKGYRKQGVAKLKKVYVKVPKYVCGSCNCLLQNKVHKYCPRCGGRLT